MAITHIEWTGTRIKREIHLEHDLRVDGKILWPAGTIPKGEVLPGFTFNGWMGCQKISRACENCYAKELVTGRMGYSLKSNDARRRLRLWGPPSKSDRHRTSEANWDRPRRWNRVAAETGIRFKVFAFSLADIGEDNPVVAPWREDLFELIDETPDLDWLLLTKRPATLAAKWPRSWRKSTPRNVWVGATVEDQECADDRIPALLSINAQLHWLSCEPLVGPLDLSDYLDRLDWVVAGGESGPGHHVWPLKWIENLHRQCTTNGVRFFCKQDSGPLPGRQGRISDEIWSTKQWPSRASRTR